MRYLFKVGLTLVLLPVFRAFATSVCGDFPRTIGPFGAGISKARGSRIGEGHLLQLKGATLVRQVFTNLSPAGEKIIAYDIDPDDFRSKTSSCLCCWW
jgi:hypothetical protein